MPSRPMRPFTALLAAAVAVAPAAAGANDFVLLRSNDRAAYLSVQEAFTAATGAASVGLSLTDPAVAYDVRRALRKAKVVVGVGPEAAAALLAVQPAAPVLLALVQRREEPGIDVVPSSPSPAQQLAAFKRAVPGLRRVGLLYGPTHPRSALLSYASAAADAGLSLRAREVASRAEAVEQARELLKAVDGLWLVPDTTVLTVETYRIFVQAALAARVPVLGFTEGMARTGALVSVEASFEEVGRCAGAAARRVLQGAPAAPYAMKGRVFVDARVASMLGLSLADEVRKEADRVFE